MTPTASEPKCLSRRSVRHLRPCVHRSRQVRQARISPSTKPHVSAPSFTPVQQAAVATSHNVLPVELVRTALVASHLWHQSRAHGLVRRPVFAVLWHKRYSIAITRKSRLTLSLHHTSLARARRFGMRTTRRRVRRPTRAQRLV